MRESNRVEGLVTEVIYANEKNGYKVCEVEHPIYNKEDFHYEHHYRH